MKFTDTFTEKSVMTGSLRQSEQRDIARRQSICYLRPTPQDDDKAVYRFRLLNFAPSENFTGKSALSHYRDYPFILRYVHTVWSEIPSEKAPDGVKRVSHSIVCPSSDYVRANSDLNKSKCPICAAATTSFAAYKDSGYKNVVARDRMKKCRNAFEAIIPVYVRKDPVFEANEGSVKALILNKEQYERLVALIKEWKLRGQPIWNNNAVDLYVSYGKVDKVIEGKNGREDFHYQANDIIRLGFTTKPSELSCDLDALVQEFNFDENFFTIPTLGEIETFYKEHYLVSTDEDDIPTDDIPSVKPAAKPVAKAETSKAEVPKAEASKPQAEDDLFEDNKSDNDEKGEEDDILADLDLPF